MKKGIILLNDSNLNKKYLDKFSNLGSPKILCADGGANLAYKLKIIPDFIIGDLDSINNKVLNYFGNKCEIIKISRQSDTDFEKVLKFCSKNKFKELIIFGIIGSRLDHSIGNISILANYSKYFKKITAIYKNNIVEIKNTSFKLKCIKDETISFFNLGNLTKVTTSGLKYNLRNRPVKFGLLDSISNKASKDTVKIKFNKGIFFIIRDIKNYFLVNESF